MAVKKYPAIAPVDAFRMLLDRHVLRHGVLTGSPIPAAGGAAGTSPGRVGSPGKHRPQSAAAMARASRQAVGDSEG